MPAVVWIALGGALGAVARYGLSSLVVRGTGSYAFWGTLTVNVLGCFALGAFLQVAADRDWLGGPVHALWATGFLGAFTTFSTFAGDADLLARRDSSLFASGYVLASVVLGIGAYVLARWIVRT